MTISSANGPTPTPLMLTPNWPDQKAGSGRCGRRSGSRLTMLCAATLPPKTALSQCSSTRNWYSYSTRDVARDKYAVGHHAVDVEDTAARVAGNSPKARGKPGTF